MLTWSYLIMETTGAGCNREPAGAEVGTWDLGCAKMKGGPETAEVEPNEGKRHP